MLFILALPLLPEPNQQMIFTLPEKELIKWLMVWLQLGWMSAASFLSMAGLIAFLGRDGSVCLMGWTGGYVLLALLLAPYLRKYGKYTVPDFIGRGITLTLHE